MTLIYVVDDDHGVAGMFAEALRTVHPRVRVYHSSEEFLKDYRNDGAVNFVLLDYDLGAGMSGVDVLREIRRREHSDNHANVVMVSGIISSYPEDVQSAQTLGAQILQKPVSLEELRALVKDMINPKPKIETPAEPASSQA